MCSRREPDNRFEQSRLLAALIPNSRLVPLDSSNHLLPEHDPAWKHFLAEIDRFLPAADEIGSRGRGTQYGRSRRPPPGRASPR